MNHLLLLPFIFVLSCFFTGVIRRYAIRRNLMDIPGTRSSHTVATPRGGGLAFILAFYLALSIDSLLSGSSTALLLSLFALPVVLVGFLDDHGHVRATYRLLVHLFSASGFVAYLLYAQNMVLPDNVFISAILVVLIVTMTTWLINLYNFMDGIDGIASVELISVTAGILLIVLLRQGGEESVAASTTTWHVVFVLAALLVAVAGFLTWNWPPASIFMGDAGSGFLGMILAILALETTRQGLVQPWSWLIMLAVFVGDATYTLIRRFLRGEKWYQAHCSHAYQRLARRLASHRAVNFVVMGINTLWLLPLAILADRYPQQAWLMMFVAYLPVIILIHRIVKNDQRIEPDK